MKRAEKSVKWYVGGMTCRNCQSRIEQKMKKTDGILRVFASYEDGTVELTYDENKISEEKVKTILKDMGYQVSAGEKGCRGDLGQAAMILSVIVLAYFLLQRTGILNFLAPGQVADSTMGYGMLFVTGLLTSTHCIAMCGGINLTQCLPKQETAVKEQAEKGGTFLPAFCYNLGRVFSYTMTGAVLGTIGFLIGGGGKPGISLFWQGALKITAGICMIIFGINRLGFFGRLRRFTIPVPGFARKIMYRTGSRKRGAFWIGVLNGFMPCGPLQSMWLVALASGNTVSGALAMLMFSLGTVPLMLGLGTAVSALGKRFTGKVLTAGAMLVVILGLSMVSQGGKPERYSLEQPGICAAKENICAARGNIGAGRNGRRTDRLQHAFCESLSGYHGPRRSSCQVDH